MLCLICSVQLPRIELLSSTDDLRGIFERAALRGFDDVGNGTHYQHSVNRFSVNSWTGVAVLDGGEAADVDIRPQPRATSTRSNCTRGLEIMFHLVFRKFDSIAKFNPMLKSLRTGFLCDSDARTVS